VKFDRFDGWGSFIGWIWMEPPYCHGSIGRDVRSAVFSRHIPPHELPAEPNDLCRDRRIDGSVSADYWNRSGHQAGQTKEEILDRLRHSPSEQHGFRRPDLYPIRSNSADQRGRGGTQVQEQWFWQKNGGGGQGSGGGGPADHPTHPCLFQFIKEVKEEEGRGRRGRRGGEEWRKERGMAESA
jgi:hypothetical protein